MGARMRETNGMMIDTYFLATVAAMLLGGCATTGTETDFTRRANAELARLDREGASPPSRDHDQIQGLWRDRPEYVALVDATPVKHMRVISAPSPVCPPVLRLEHVNGRVIVSFVVGIGGRVEDARVVETSDTRFNDSALDAVRRFTFTPAKGVNGPIREIASLPMNFFWFQ
jgi:TonB family protein